MDARQAAIWRAALLDAIAQGCSVPPLPPLHPAQDAVLRAARRFNVLCCGRRWGKTWFAIDRAIRAACAGQPVGWFAPTYKYLSDAWREVVRLTHGITTRVSVQEHRIELRGGGLIDFWSLDDPNAGRGRKYGCVCIDEAALVYDLADAWQGAIRPALTDLRGAAWFLSTPKGHDDFYALYERGQRPDQPEWASWQLPTETNTTIPELLDELAVARTAMDARYFAQEFEASFEEMAGRVYFKFDRAQNVRELPDPGGDLLVGMDFNVAPMSAVLAVRAADELHVLDELELTNSNTEEMCHALRRRYPERSICVYPDPSGSARKTSAPVGMTDFSVIRGAGFQLRAPIAAPPVVDRINEVNALCCNAANRRTLFVHPRCRAVIRSLTQLAYKDGQTVVDKTTGLDHMADALGYLVHVEFPLVRPPTVQQQEIW